MARHDFAILQRFFSAANAANHPLRGERVLDIGCGYRFPITLLLHSLGARVTGLDTERVGPRQSVAQLYGHFVKHGSVAAAKRFVRESIHKPVYFRALEQASGRRLSFEGLDLRQGRIEDLTMENEFDVVFSNATFEHLSNVDHAVQVLARVVKPKGLVYISIHLFPSLSGGHDLAQSVSGTTEVRLKPGRIPWEHLRDPGWRPPISLNRLREHEYRQIFERHLRIRQWNSEFWEREDFLTREIRQELTAFTREELLKRSVVVLAERLGN